MEPSVWKFVLFVVIALAWAVSSFLTFIPFGVVSTRREQLKAGPLVATMFASEILTYGFLILILLVLTGSAHLELFLAMTAATIVGYTLSAFLWLIVERRDVPYVSVTVWAQRELKEHFPRAVATQQLLGLAPLLILIVYIGIGYFGSAFASPDWQKYVLRATIAGLFGLSWLLMLPASIYTMASRNVSSGTRARVLLNQLAQIPSVLLLISVFMWASDSDAELRPLFGTFFVYAPEITYVLIGYVLLIVILPFIVGMSRSERWAETLKDRRTSFSSQFTEALRKGNVSTALSGVGAVHAAVDQEVRQLESEGWMRLTRTLEQSTDPGDVLLKVALRDVRDLDPRFGHLRQLIDLRTRTDDVRQNVAQLADDKTKFEFMRQEADVVDKIAQGPDTRSSRATTVIVAAGLSLLAALASPVVAAVAKKLVAQMGLPTD
jgi:hypothetical protein